MLDKTKYYSFEIRIGVGCFADTYFFDFLASDNHPDKPTSVKRAYKLGKRNVSDKTYAQEPAGKQGALRTCAEHGGCSRLLFPQAPLLANISPKKEKMKARIRVVGGCKK